MKISELLKLYPNEELTKQKGDPELRYNVYSPILKDLVGKKVIYRERYTCIIRIQNVEINHEYFEAKAVFLNLVTEKHRLVPLSEWIFGAAWWILHISGNHLVPYSSWALWIDDDIVKEVEKLILEKRFDEAWGLLD
jgi:hypothetical protein